MDAHAKTCPPAAGRSLGLSPPAPLRARIRLLPILLAAVLLLSATGSVFAQNTSSVSPPSPAPAATDPSAAPSQNVLKQLQLPDLSKRDNFSAAMQIIILLTVLSLAPAILIMMTSFTRIIIVLSLLRQALGTQQLPPNQVLIGLALFMTFVVMGPTWQQLNAEALQPYMDGKMSQKDALSHAQVPLRNFMIRQINAAGNDSDVDVFTDFQHKERAQKWDDVGTMTLIPAFMLSELSTAFLLGFKVYLPFLVIDMVISAVLISMGMMMLPPTLISLPFKLLLFVLVNGWHLVVAGLMGSFAR
jgi:flagellar biosynthetic protein FliP